MAKGYEARITRGWDGHGNDGLGYLGRRKEEDSSWLRNIRGQINETRRSVVLLDEGDRRPRDGACVTLDLLKACAVTLVPASQIDVDRIDAGSIPTDPRLIEKQVIVTMPDLRGRYANSMDSNGGWFFDDGLVAQYITLATAVAYADDGVNLARCAGQFGMTETEAVKFVESTTNKLLVGDAPFGMVTSLRTGGSRSDRSDAKVADDPGGDNRYILSRRSGGGRDGDDGLAGMVQVASAPSRRRNGGGSLVLYGIGGLIIITAACAYYGVARSVDASDVIPIKAIETAIKTRTLPPTVEVTAVVSKTATVTPEARPTSTMAPTPNVPTENQLESWGLTRAEFDKVSANYVQWLNLWARMGIFAQGSIPPISGSNGLVYPMVWEHFNDGGNRVMVVKVTSGDFAGKTFVCNIKYPGCPTPPSFEDVQSGKVRKDDVMPLVLSPRTSSQEVAFSGGHWVSRDKVGSKTVREYVDWKTGKWTGGTPPRLEKTATPQPTLEQVEERPAEPTLEPTTVNAEFDFSQIDYKPNTVEGLAKVMESPNPIESPDTFDRWVQLLKVELDAKARAGWLSFENDYLGTDASGTRVVQGEWKDGGIFYRYRDTTGDWRYGIVLYDGRMISGVRQYYFVDLFNVLLNSEQNFLKKQIGINNGGGRVELRLYTNQDVIPRLGNGVPDSPLKTKVMDWALELIRILNENGAGGAGDIFDPNVNRVYPGLLMTK